MLALPHWTHWLEHDWCLTQGRQSILIKKDALGHVRLGVLVMNFLSRLILTLQVLVMHHWVRHVQALSRMAWLRAVLTLWAWKQLISNRQGADPVQGEQLFN